MISLDTLRAASEDEEDIDLGALSRSVGFMVRMAQIATYKHFFLTFPDVNVRPGEYSVLWAISLNPGVRQGALGNRLKIKRAHMTKLVQRFIESGLVERKQSQDDRRTLTLTLTRAGQDHVNHHRKAFFDIDPGQGLLTPGEVKQLLYLLNKIAYPESPTCQ